MPIAREFIVWCVKKLRCILFLCLFSMHQVGKLTIRVQIPSALELPGYKGKPSIINACKLPAEKYFSQDKNGSRGCFNEGVFKKSYGLKT